MKDSVQWDPGSRSPLYIHNEKGILKKDGPSFHTPVDFALRHLFYIIWSDLYVCSRLYLVQRDCLDSFSLTHVRWGRMEFVYDGQTFTLGENEAILLDLRKPHRYRALEDGTVKWEMVFNGNASADYYQLITEQWGNVFWVEVTTGRILEDLIAETKKSVPRDHRISTLIAALFSALIDQNQKELSLPVQAAVQYIADHFSEPLQVDLLASRAALSRHYFSRRFLMETGYTPHDYIRNYRINLAKELLAEKDLSVTEIAEKCGFVNTSHFIRIFRQTTGQTPSAFRKSFTLLGE